MLPHQARRRLENTQRRGCRGHFFPISDRREKHIGQMTGEKNKGKLAECWGEDVSPSEPGMDRGRQGRGRTGVGVPGNHPGQQRPRGGGWRNQVRIPCLSGGEKKGGGHLLTMDFLICSEASAPSGLAFSAWYGPKSLAAQPAPWAGFGGSTPAAKQ